MINPKTLYIQITSKCNNKCKICFFFDKQYNYVFDNHDMEDNVIENILNNIKQMPELKYVIFAPFYGEPFLHPKIFEMIDSIKTINKDIQISLLTNGKLITEDNISKYNGNFIFVSVLGNKTNSPTYEEITGLSWNDLYDKIDLLNKYKIKHIFNLCCSDINNVEEAIKDLIKLDNSQIIYHTPTIPNDMLTHIMNCKAMNEKYVKVRLNNFVRKYELSLKQHNIKNIGYPDFDIPKCSLDYNECYIDSYGNMILCCRDNSMKSIVGNIKDSSITEIFNNEYMTKVRETFNKSMHKDNPCQTLCNPLFKLFNKEKN